MHQLGLSFIVLEPLVLICDSTITNINQYPVQDRSGAISIVRNKSLALTWKDIRRVF